MEYGQVLLWWIAFQALALLGVPVASLLFPRFADRGAGFALPLALVVITTISYWLGHVQFSRLTLFAGVAILGALAAIAILRGVDISWRKHAEGVAVFTLAFALLIAIRAFDPAIHPAGGEKFLDYGLLKSLLRAEQLPPRDIWFAGESVQYYYGGHLIVALLTKLTSSPPRFAYNLALAGFYAMIVSTAYGLAGAVADEFDTDARVAGGFAAFFVGIASNISTPFALLVGALPQGLASPLASLFSTTVEDIATTPGEFYYWPASRVIPGTINEFPLFAFLNGDLHAHMMSPPFLLLGAALLYAYFRAPRSEQTRRRLLLFGALPIVTGLLTIINTWSLPTILGLTFLTLTFADPHPLDLLARSLRSGRKLDWDDWRVDEISRGIGALVGTGLVALLSVGWAIPFFLDTASSRGIGFFPEQSGLGGLVLVHGAFLLIFAVHLFARAWPPERKHADQDIVLGGLLVVLGIVGNLDVIVLVGPLIVLGWYLLRTRTDVGYETVLLIAGAGLVVLVEFLYVKENAGPGRYNTVFKIYAQVWILWATAAGIALPRAVSYFRRTDVPLPFTATRRDQFAAVLIVVLLVSVSVYGGMALGKHFTGTSRFETVENATLDATQFVEREHPGELEAIAWLDERDGQPTILTEPGLDMYQWTNAPSTLTGLPTVAGWIHEIGYRNRTVYNQRATDVRFMYEGSAERRVELLDKYDVEYIYVGPKERQRYGEVSYGGVSGVAVAFQSEDVTIYSVDQSSLSEEKLD